MQEILVVAAIALVVIFIPRFMGRGSAAEPRRQSRPPARSPFSTHFSAPGMALTGWMRLMIVATVLWMAGGAAYFKPWEGDSFLFFCVSFGPVAALWGGIWAWFGFKKHRR